jgi:hypothetical protein
MRPVRKCAGAQMEFMRSAGEAYVFSMCLPAVLLAVLRLRLSQDRHPAARRDNVTCGLVTLTRPGRPPAGRLSQTSFYTVNCRRVQRF